MFGLGINLSKNLMIYSVFSTKKQTSRLLRVCGDSGTFVCTVISFSTTKRGTDGIGAAFSITGTDVDASCGAITFGIMIYTVFHAARNALYVLWRIVDVG